VASSATAPSSLVRSEGAAEAGPGDVFTLTNATSGNSIEWYRRSLSGTLSSAGTYPTGGTGSGDGLNGASNTIAYDASHNLLYAVDAGSNDIVSFQVNGSSLQRIDKVPSGGTEPVSLAVHDNVLYVLNAGSNQISGFTTDQNGHLAPIAGSTRALSGSASDDPVDLRFGPDGSTLIATEKLSNNIDIFTIDSENLPSGPTPRTAAGQTPFGFAVTPSGQLIVAEASNAAKGQAAVSSYDISRTGALSVVSASVPNHQTASCWIAITPDGRFAYAANSPNDDLSGYAIGAGGRLSLLNQSGVAAAEATGSHPVDIATSVDGRFLYVLNQFTGTIAPYSIGNDGKLSPLATVAGLPPNSVIGLAVH
jgi:6-phosphogluconolactonase